MPNSIRAASSQRLPLGPALAKRFGNRVLCVIFRHELINLGVCHYADVFDQVAYAVSVDRISQSNLGFDFIAFGHGDFAHIVAESGDLAALCVVPGACRPHPSPKLVQNFPVPPETDHDFPVQPHSAADETEFAVAVGGLV